MSLAPRLGSLLLTCYRSCSGQRSPATPFGVSPVLDQPGPSDHSQLPRWRPWGPHMRSRPLRADIHPSSSMAGDLCPVDDLKTNLLALSELSAVPVVILGTIHTRAPGRSARLSLPPCPQYHGTTIRRYLNTACEHERSKKSWGSRALLNLISAGCTQVGVRDPEKIFRIPRALLSHFHPHLWTLERTGSWGLTKQVYPLISDFDLSGPRE
jgi:hypothetical protein